MVHYLGTSQIGIFAHSQLAETSPTKLHNLRTHNGDNYIFPHNSKGHKGTDWSKQSIL